MEAGGNFIIRGSSHTGKTTFAKKLAQELSRFSPKGFYTEELTAGPHRTGYRLVFFDGGEIEIKKPPVSQAQRSWRYETDTAELDRRLSALEKAAPRLVIIDELGKLETTSPKLLALAAKWLSPKTIFIATAPTEATAPVERLLDRDDIELYTLNRLNMERAIDSISKEVHHILKG